MTDQEAIDTLTAGYELLCLWSRNIALLPLEEWRDQLARTEVLGAIVDPTLYRDYLYSDKVRVLKDVINAAIPLKRVVLAAQDVAKREGRARE